MKRFLYTYGPSELRRLSASCHSLSGKGAQSKGAIRGDLDASDVSAVVGVLNLASGLLLRRFFEDRRHRDGTDTIVQLFYSPHVWLNRNCSRSRLIGVGKLFL